MDDIDFADYTRRLAVYDIHGNFRGLNQAMERANFDPFGDFLLCGGDIVDGGPDSAEVIDWIHDYSDQFIMGNHDQWFFQWVLGNCTHVNQGEPVWINQGGKATVESVLGHKNVKGIYRKARALEKKSLPYLIFNRMFFSHAGFDPEEQYDNQTQMSAYMWDRKVPAIAASIDTRGLKRTKEFLPTAISGKAVSGYIVNSNNFDRIFLGHTPAGFLDYRLKDFAPGIWGKVVDLDTSAGSKGKVTVMDVDTLEYWQSDDVQTLYGKKSFMVN